jgi:hypothetical protein
MKISDLENYDADSPELLPWELYLSSIELRRIVLLIRSAAYSSIQEDMNSEISNYPGLRAVLNIIANNIEADKGSIV